MTIRIGADRIVSVETGATAYKVDRVLDGCETWVCPVWKDALFLHHQILAALRALEWASRTGWLPNDIPPGEGFEEACTDLVVAGLTWSDIPLVTTWQDQPEGT